MVIAICFRRFGIPATVYLVAHRLLGMLSLESQPGLQIGPRPERENRNSL